MGFIKIFNNVGSKGASALPCPWTSTRLRYFLDGQTGFPYEIWFLIFLVRGGIHLLDVDSVSKRYANRRGVEDIHFSMARGEIAGFLGPNGAGKTTTMRMITGYLMPSKGEVRVDGIYISEHSGKPKRKIGYLPETPPLYPDMTVYGYLKLIADLREIPVREQKRRIGETMERVGIQEKAAQLIRSLSKGYKQRVGLAQESFMNRIYWSWTSRPRDWIPTRYAKFAD